MGTLADPERLPHRRLRMELAMHADSLSDACDALRRIADDLHQDGLESVHRASGREHASHGVSLEVVDPAMDGGRYRAALQLWKASRVG
jgi:hypothetical protein